jgi:signal transduction histidine kinase/DNA-binding response OmpR family regulator
MKKIIVAFLLLSYFTSFSQNEAEIATLQQNLITEKDATEKGEILDKLVELHYWNNREKGLEYLQDLLQHGLLTNNNYSLYRGYYLKSLSLNAEVAKDSAIIYLSKAISYAKKEQNVAHTCEGLIKKADYYIYYNDSKNAKKALNESLDIAKKAKNYDYMCRTYNVIGLLYQSKKMYGVAFKNFIAADSIFSKNNLEKNSWGENKMYIGDLFKAMNLTKPAKENYFNAQKLFVETKNDIGSMHATKMIGEIYFVEKNYIKAEENFIKFYNFYKNHAFKSNYGSGANLLGNLNLKKNSFDKANSYFNEALKVYTENSNYSGQIETLLNIGNLNEKSGKLNDANNNFNNALNIAKKEKIITFNEVIYLKLGQVYSKLANSNQANYFYEKHLKIKDSLVNLNENQEVFELEIKNINDKKNTELKLIQSEKQKQTYIYIGLIVLLLSLGTFFYLINKNKIKTAQKLQELNELKSRFFANISHEFRTPLTLIKSPVQSLQAKITEDSQQKELQLIDTNSNRMLELVDQLLELSKIDAGNLKLILKDGNISSFMHIIIEPFDFSAKENNINFVSNIYKKSENDFFDKDVIEKIITNLVSNAFKYTTEKEQINFSASFENQTLKLIVSNSGSDIKKEDLSKLFERFYQKKENSQGVGIGLALVKELVDLYQGTIETSVENNVLSFTVLLPLENNNANAIVVPASKSTEIIANDIDADNELPILLIVDDNAEIRSVLVNLFKENYTILEAEDGEKGYKLAQKEIPDCIISDVMMPKMDGFEFTKAIKNNELTSFIPVVLLTAKTSDEAHLEGLQSASDAFLTKPFNNDIVRATVFQLIEERRKLQNRYSQELVLRPVDIVINSVDEKFLEKIQLVLEKEFSNASFSSDDFANAVGMSRMQLHRKLKSLLGVTATEFLRNERLKTAAKLLKEGNGNISEIAYSVGFNDLSYFAKCFKEVYSVTPTEYLNKKDTP